MFGHLCLIKHDVIGLAPMGRENDAPQFRRTHNLKTGFLFHLTNDGFDRCFIALHTAAGHMPTVDIAVAHQKNAALVIENRRFHAHGDGAAQARPKPDEAMRNAKGPMRH